MEETEETELVASLDAMSSQVLHEGTLDRMATDCLCGDFLTLPTQTPFLLKACLEDSRLYTMKKVMLKRFKHDMNEEKSAYERMEEKCGYVVQVIQKRMMNMQTDQSILGGKSDANLVDESDDEDEDLVIEAAMDVLLNLFMSLPSFIVYCPETTLRVIEIVLKSCHALLPKCDAMVRFLGELFAMVDTGEALVFVDMFQTHPDMSFYVEEISRQLPLALKSEFRLVFIFASLQEVPRPPPTNLVAFDSIFATELLKCDFNATFIETIWETKWWITRASPTCRQLVQDMGGKQAKQKVFAMLGQGQSISMQAPRCVHELLTSQQVRSPLPAQAGIDATFFRTVSSHPMFVNNIKLGQSLTPIMIDACLKDGFTVGIRAIHTRSRALFDICAKMQYCFGHPISANLYWTPPGEQGLEAHYDDHCVFVFQLHGKKVWYLYEQASRLPMLHDLKKVDEPSLSLEENGEGVSIIQTLQEGDILYIPRGMIHKASTVGVEEESIHVSFGVNIPTEWTIRGLMEKQLHALFLTEPSFQRHLNPGITTDSNVDTTCSVGLVLLCLLRWHSHVRPRHFNRGVLAWNVLLSEKSALWQIMKEGWRLIGQDLAIGPALQFMHAHQNEPWNEWPVWLSKSFFQTSIHANSFFLNDHLPLQKCLRMLETQSYDPSYQQQQSPPLFYQSFVQTHHPFLYNDLLQSFVHLKSNQFLYNI